MRGPVPVPGPRFAMRPAIASGFHSRLLRVFQPRKGYASSASGAGSAPATAASGQPLHQQAPAVQKLAEALAAERVNSLHNVQRDLNAVGHAVGSTLQELAGTQGLAEQHRQALLALGDKAQQYAALPKPQRQALLRDIEVTLGLPGSSAPPAVARYGQNRLQERAGRYSHISPEAVALQHQQQEAYRRAHLARQQQQQQQQGQQPGQQPGQSAPAPFASEPGSVGALPPSSSARQRFLVQRRLQQQQGHWQQPQPTQQQQQQQQRVQQPAAAAAPPQPLPQQPRPASAPAAKALGPAAVVAASAAAPQAPAAAAVPPQSTEARQAHAPPAAPPTPSSSSSGTSTSTKRKGPSAPEGPWPAGWTRPAEYEPPPVSATQRLVPILFDLETSSGGTTSNFLLEIAAKNLQSQQRFTSFARLGPREYVSQQAAEVHGLDTAAMRSAAHPERREVLRSFCKWLEEQRAVAGPDAMLLLMGHNILAFDCPVVIHNMQQAGLGPPPHARLLDTLVLAKQIPALFNRSCALKNLAEFYRGAPVGQLHRAMADVELNEEVLGYLWQELERNGGPPSGGSWEALMDAYSRQLAPGRIKRWLGEIDWRPASKAKPSPPATAAAPAPRPVSKLEASFERAALQAARAGAALGAGATDAAAAAVLGSLDGGDGEESVDEFDFEKPEDDPLIDLEAGPAPAGPPPTFEALVASRDAWRRLLEGSASGSRQSFLDTPLDAFKKGEHRFTPKPLRVLTAAGVTTLQELLECYPRERRLAEPGALPEEDGDCVCLPVRLVGDVKESGGSTPSVRAQLEVVPPEALGLPGTPASAAIAAASPPCSLQLARFSSFFPALRAIRQDLEAQLAGGAVVYGRVKRSFYGRGWDFANSADVEFLPWAEAQELFEAGRPYIETVYSACGKLSGKDMAGHVATALGILEASPDSWQDPLPADVLEEYCPSPMGYLEALKGYLQPETVQQMEEARRRLAFQELLILQLRLLLQRRLLRLPDREEELRGVHISDYSLAHRAIASLPYQLTGGQQRALEQLLAGMRQWPPMMCLLQGDVGCGKTIVAFLALLAAAGSGYQGAIMAPTEILAEQHFANLQRLLGQMEAAGGPPLPATALLTGSVKGKERARIYAGLADGSIGLVVGTHALISQGLAFKQLGLAVVDEQHRFGVAQRTRLHSASCPSPHVLYMTATPIPRTTALVWFAEMAQVVIDELPPGRTRVATHALVDSEASRRQVYQHMHREIAEGGQVYIICPLVEESAAESLAEVKAAKQEMARLVAEGIFSEGQCGLLHGQMKSAEKEAALRAFARGDTPVLISTTVVEVGVDVPAASMILVEHADRFGLAQLHQLRGRVGRGARPSTCYLVADSPDSMERLRVMERHHSGFHVAEADIYLRGPGEVLGTTQSGKKQLAALKLCRLPEDRDLVPRAREAAAKFLAGHAADPATWRPELLSLVLAGGKFRPDLPEGPAASGAGSGSDSS